VWYFRFVLTVWYFRIVLTVWYFRIVLTVWYFRIVLTVWYFRIVLTVWYFRIVLTLWYFRIVLTLWYFRIVLTVWYFRIVLTLWYFRIVLTLWYFRIVLTVWYCFRFVILLSTYRRSFVHASNKDGGTVVVMVRIGYTKGRVQTILLEFIKRLNNFFCVCNIGIYINTNVDHLMLYYSEHRTYIANIIYNLITGWTTYVIHLQSYHRVDNVRHTFSLKRKYCRND
jgi:hypothetical protein